ncbi:polyprenyl synthetase family protein [Amycolatopsis sp. cg5]|uniref:polyprenyl synthetase family protein n=1 Tax=Amycolatopsis sp. cg5 TaxID=3238802 RepID=UPI003524478A
MTSLAGPLNTLGPALGDALERRRLPDSLALAEMLRYSLLPPGKLLRPLLLLESAAAVGGDPRELVDVSLAVEYLHVATLVHDDIIDGDLTRRGREAVHSRYGLANGIVTGDALLFTAFEALSRQGPADAVLRAMSTLARTGLELCEGQVEEAALVENVHCGLERYLKVATLKTGALFRCACEVGALLGGADVAEAAALRDYGDHLGRAFQMRDDLLPYLESPDQSGKSACSDVLNRRPTLPVLLAVEVADRASLALIEESLSGGLPPEVARARLAGVLDDLGVLGEAQERIRAEVDAARALLDGLSGGRTSALHELAEFTVRGAGRTGG